MSGLDDSLRDSVHLKGLCLSKIHGISEQN
jgi:hypothetical protein